MAENKTKPTSVRVDDYLLTVSQQRYDEAQQLIARMAKISCEKPVMWGPSIISFGSQHYTSEAGREGNMPVLGFSPRKARLTIYFYEGFDRYGKELSALGKHTITQGCLYINKLADIDIEVLEAMLRSSYKLATTPKASMDTSVEDYIKSISPAAGPKFDELRSVVKKTLPHAREVVSYGIVGYKIDDKRARVFISGWKDHVALYPVPKNENLRTQLEPYIKGKGTLWFMLDSTLPKDLIVQVVKDLAA